MPTFFIYKCAYCLCKTEYFAPVVYMVHGQCVTLHSFQVFNNESFNDKLPLNYVDGSTRKTIAFRLTDVTVFKFEHVIVTWNMGRGGRLHQRARPPDFLFQNTTIAIKL